MPPTQPDFTQAGNPLLVQELTKAWQEFVLHNQELLSQFSKSEVKALLVGCLAQLTDLPGLPPAPTQQQLEEQQRLILDQSLLLQLHASLVERRAVHVQELQRRCLLFLAGMAKVLGEVILPKLLVGVLLAA